MLFPTVQFALFFPVVLALSWALMKRQALWKPFIIVASYVFYGYADWRFCLLLGAITVGNQWAAVLIARVILLPASPWPIAGATVTGAVVLSLLAGWWRRPAALDVAISADLNLKLKQRLSTAWEYMGASGDGALTDRLALQAVGAGLPDDPWSVFPLRVNRWGWLVPLAAMALPSACQELLVNDGGFDSKRTVAAELPGPSSTVCGPLTTTMLS